MISIAEKSSSRPVAFPVTTRHRSPAVMANSEENRASVGRDQSDINRVENRISKVMMSQPSRRFKTLSQSPETLGSIITNIRRRELVDLEVTGQGSALFCSKHETRAGSVEHPTPPNLNSVMKLPSIRIQQRNNEKPKAPSNR